MSIQTTIRIPLTIPPVLQGNTNYTIQFSVHNEAQAMDVYVEDHMKAADLAAGSVAVIERSSLPQFSTGAQRILRANYWKGSKLIGTEVLGAI
jgi:hypothetical protein